MEIYIGNLPENISVLELRRLFGDVGKSRFRLYNRKARSGQTHCFGHAIIEEISPEENVIDRLHGQVLHGCELVARPFVHRNDNNDRRTHYRFTKPWLGVNRRHNERRGNFHA